MRIISFALALLFALMSTQPASTQIAGQPANSFVVGAEWYCVSGYRKTGNQCVSIFAEIGGKPANSFVVGAEWYCVSGYRKTGNQCVSIFAEIGGKPANSFVVGAEWYCVSGYRKTGNQCVSIFAEIGGKPANSFVVGAEWYCVSGYRKTGNQCVSIFASNPSSSAAEGYNVSGVPAPVGVPCAENGSCYGDISAATGRARTVPVQGYFRRDGTYVRGHYRSRRN